MSEEGRRKVNGHWGEPGRMGSSTRFVPRASVKPESCWYAASVWPDSHIFKEKQET